MAEFFSEEEEARVDDILAVDLYYWIGLTDFASEGMKDTSDFYEKQKNYFFIRSLDMAGKS